MKRILTGLVLVGKLVLRRVENDACDFTPILAFPHQGGRD